MAQGFIGGYTSPTQQVEQYKNKELQGLLSGVPGATAGPTSTAIQRAGADSDAKRMGLPSSPGSPIIDMLGALGNSDRTAAAQQQQLTTIAHQTAQGQSPVGRPYDYSTPAGTSYKGNYSGVSYTKQQAGAKGMGGRSGLTVKAGNSLTALERQFFGVFGTGFKINYGYRSSKEQARLYALYKAGKGNLAAPPGHSMHERGIAIDLGGPFTNANSAQHRWLQRNGPKYGWYWVGKNYGEPWHWEYRGR